MPPRAPETAGRLVMDDRTGRASLVSAPHRPASPGLRDREHGDQRGDRASGREREGTGRARPKGRRCRSGDRADHPGRNGGAATDRPRRGRTMDGPEPRVAHWARRGSSDARPPRPSRPEDELRCEAHRGGRRRQHRRALGPAHGDGRGDPRGRGKGVRRQVGSDRSGDPFMRRAQAHKIRATRDERLAGPRSLLIVHAAELITLQGPAGPRRREMAEDLGLVEDGAVYAEGERIVDVGPTADVLGRHPQASVKIDATGQTVLPGFVDAHTHAVFAGSREHEVEWKAQGMGYREIAARGGGILHTVRATREASEEQLARTATERFRSMLAFGTTTIEVKSGYGLRTEDELKTLRAAATAGEAAGVDVVRTFLGAHAIPPEFEGRAEAYVELVAGDMMDAVASSRLATFCDVFVDDGFFTADQARRILNRAKSAGLGGKIHADELADTGGAALAAEISPISWSSASPRTAISATGLAGMWSGSSSSEAPSNSTVHSDRGCPSFAGGGFFSPTRIPRCRSLMIARTWHGVTATSKADAYFQVLQDTGLKEYRDTPGNQGGIVLRRTDGDVTHFLLITFWESFDAIRRFAGPNPERSVYYPEDKEFLLEFEPTVTHYDVLVSPDEWR